MVITLTKLFALHLPG